MTPMAVRYFNTPRLVAAVERVIETRDAARRETMALMRPSIPANRPVLSTARVPSTVAAGETRASRRWKRSRMAPGECRAITVDPSTLVEDGASVAIAVALIDGARWATVESVDPSRDRKAAKARPVDQREDARARARKAAGTIRMGEQD